MEPSVDTLGRWMAHYVAELMVRAGAARADEQPGAQKLCFEAILQLWSHRAQLPSGKQPFEELDPVMRAIESLDPENERPRYFRPVTDAEAPDEEHTARKLIEFAEAIDSTARILIGACLAEAAEAALDKSKPWVELAHAAEADLGVHSIVVHYASEVADIGRTGDLSDPEREKLRKRVSRLEAFTEAATLVLKELRGRLDAVRSEGDPTPESSSQSTDLAGEANVDG